MAFMDGFDNDAFSEIGIEERVGKGEEKTTSMCQIQSIMTLRLTLGPVSGQLS